MESYTIIRSNGGADWENANVLPISHPLFGSHTDVTAQAQLCYDKDAIYVRFRAKEKNIRREHTQMLCEVCEDSCFEFFFSPMAQDIRYFNVEMNANGAYYLGFGDCFENLQRLIPENMPIGHEIQMTDDGWTLEYRIPCSFIRLFFPDFTPTPGSAIRANCYKCAELAEPPYWLSWNPLPEGVTTFHSPRHFGIMYFG